MVKKTIVALLISGTLASSWTVQAEEEEQAVSIRENKPMDTITLIKRSFDLNAANQFKRKRVYKFPVGLALEAETNLTCGNFDISASISNTFDGLNDQVTKVWDDLVASATGLASSLPAIIWARADPVSYEAVSNFKLEAEALFNVGVASCEQMVEKVSDPSADFNINGLVTLSMEEDWRGQYQSGSSDPVSIMNKVNEDAGDSGITAVDGTKQATSSKPYNIADNLLTGATEALPPEEDSNSIKDASESGNMIPDIAFWQVHWDTVEQAKSWIESVIGTIEVRTCKECSKLTTKAGRGAYSILAAEQQRYYELLDNYIYTRTTRLTADELKALNKGSVVVNQAIIDSLKGLDMPSHKRHMEALAFELAMSDVLAKLRDGKRMLAMGIYHPQILDNPEIFKMAKEYVSRIDVERQALQMEWHLSEEIKMDAVSNILIESNKNKLSGDERTRTNVVEQLQRLNNRD